ncbi:neuropeptide FF receptor 2 isoform X1 [Nematostella vectensis]|uniref:neuropeptide FF receptor 2 isoform X1 n=1 Tax=Nematostella vectensis TaxID=45351 RepID=UPI001390312B|nr:neuropeptide FF receptor 2 isoform X1 [Nematostella vectensis]
MKKVTMSAPPTNSTNATECFLSLVKDLPSIVAIKILAYCIVWVVSLVGNTLVILVVLRNDNMHTTINYFIVNMACSDLAVPLFAIPIRVTEKLRGTGEWLVGGEAGNALCKISYFLTDVSPVVSVLSLIIITVDRFAAVVFPMRATLFSSTVRGTLIALTWIIGMAVFAPYFYTFRVQGKDCISSWEPAFEQLPTQIAFVSVICVMFIIVPFITLTVLYTVMSAQLWKTSNRVASMQTSDIARNQRRKNIRVFYMSLTIVVIFGLCYGPYNCFMLALNFYWRWDTEECSTMVPRVFYIAQFLTFCNSAANPFVYFVFVTRYRQGLKKLCSRPCPSLPAATRHTFETNSFSRREDLVASSVAEFDPIHVTAYCSKQASSSRDQGDCFVENCQSEKMARESASKKATSSL